MTPKTALQYNDNTKQDYCIDFYSKNVSLSIGF